MSNTIIDSYNVCPPHLWRKPRSDERRISHEGLFSLSRWNVRSTVEIVDGVVKSEDFEVHSPFPNIGTDLVGFHWYSEVHGVVSSVPTPYTLLTRVVIREN